MSREAMRDAGAAAYRCSRCRDTGLVWTSWNHECSAGALPCDCRRGKDGAVQDRSALWIELAVGIPIAGCATVLLLLFR